jgi:hypothetical protein
VDDRFEGAPGLVVAEDASRESGPVERSAAFDALSEGLADATEDDGILRGPPRQRVGVDDGGAPLGQERRDGGLTRADVAGQADPQRRCGAGARRHATPRRVRG